MTDETREVEAILGPYRGQRLTMTTADADTAINDHWARDPFSEDPPHDPLTEEERSHALEASKAWAAAQQAAAAGEEPPPVEPPPEEGGATRAMGADDQSGKYKTRRR